MEITFGQALKELRRSKNISQRDLADRCGIDFSYISKLENDRLPPPSADTIANLCEILNVPIETLLTHSKKLTTELKDSVLSNPNTIRFLNEIKTMNLTDGEWGSLMKKLKKLR